MKQTKRAPWWLYPLAIFVPGATSVDIKLQIEAFIKHTATTFKLNMQSTTNSKDGPPKPNDPWYPDFSSRKYLCFIKTECYVYTPAYHKNVTGFLKDMNTQIGALKDPSVSSVIG